MLTPCTTILVGASGQMDDVMIVDVSLDRRRVVVTSPIHREEGTPFAALDLVLRLRQAHGDKVAEFCDAVERAASCCIIEEEKLS